MDNATIAIGAGLALALLMGKREGTGAPVPAGAPTIDDLLAAIKQQDADYEFVVGELNQDEDPDWLLVGDYQDAHFLRQMWLPASRVRVDTLTPADVALALLFLGAVPSAPVLSKGGAAGCPLTKFEKQIAKVNKKFQAEADAAGGVGELLNIVASIFGANTKEFDKSYGLGRAKTEILKAQFDLTTLSGVRTGNLRKTLAWDTPLARPTRTSAFTEIARDAAGVAVTRKEDAPASAGGGWQIVPVTYPKNGQIFLMTSDPGLTFNATTGYGRDNIAATGLTKGIGPAFRPGLFQLQTLTNNPSAGTIDHSTPLGDVAEFALPWNSQALGCGLTLRQRIFVRARLYRTLDFMASKLYALSPQETRDAGPYGTRSLEYLYGAGGVLGHRLYWYETPGGAKIEGSVFPPSDPVVVIGPAIVNAPRAVTAPGAADASGVQAVTAAAPAATPRAPAPTVTALPPLVSRRTDGSTLGGRIIGSKLSGT